MSLRDAAEIARLREAVEKQAKELAELKSAVAALTRKKNGQAV